jgi:hypothetical protein
VNTGQTDYQHLTLSLSGIPDDYYNMTSEIEQLKAGEEKKISIDFKIPEDAGITSHNGKLKVDYNNNSLEQQFILSISSGVVNKTENISTNEGFKLPSIFTGNFVLPTPRLDVLSFIGIAILTFSISFLLKGRKLKTVTERKEIKNTLLDIKGEIERHSVTNIKKLKKKKSK